MSWRALPPRAARGGAERNTDSSPAAAENIPTRIVETLPTMSNLVYFSSVSGNTHRFITRLGLPADRLPTLPRDAKRNATEPYVLVLPTYGGGTEGGAVPKQVIAFLNDPHNRSLIRGVIGAGNTNFGAAYCKGADIVAAKCNVPVLYRFEVFGTPDDLTEVRKGLEQFWTSQPQEPPR
jgi:protein involved in ribonucleotide reduction